MRRPPLLVATVVVVLAACDGDAPPARPDSVVTTTLTPPLPAPATASSGWEAEFGPALFVTVSDGQPQVVLPTITDSTFADSSAWAGATLGPAPAIELFARAGRVGAVHVAPNAAIRMPDGTGAGDGCIGWPVVQTLEAAPAPWSAGFAQGRATAIPLDSIEALAPADSARLAADAARLASQLPNDTAVAFTGLPFVVRTAWRLRLPDGTQVLVADVTRRIGQEADPREQHVFLVAERASPSAPWRPDWFSRTSGPEDETEMRELLAAVLLGPTKVATLVLGVTYEEGTSYALVVRGADGTWKEKWSSAYTGC